MLHIHGRTCSICMKEVRAMPQYHCVWIGSVCNTLTCAMTHLWLISMWRIIITHPWLVPTWWNESLLCVCVKTSLTAGLDNSEAMYIQIYVYYRTRHRQDAANVWCNCNCIKSTTREAHGEILCMSLLYITQVTSWIWPTFWKHTRKHTHTWKCTCTHTYIFFEYIAQVTTWIWPMAQVKMWYDSFSWRLKHAQRASDLKKLDLQITHSWIWVMSQCVMKQSGWSLGTPVNCFLNLTGTPVEICLKFWQS